LGQALRGLRRFDEAIDSCQRSIAIDPNLFEGHNGLAYAFLGAGEIDAAIREYRRAVELRPQSGEVYCNLANAVGLSGDITQSRALLYQALKLDPNSVLAHWNLSLNLLLSGELSTGWREYEWRWLWEGFSGPREMFSQPQWDGTHLNGKTILLHYEQGFGDTMQFVRYVPLVAARGGTTVISCQPELVRLLRCTPELGQIVERNTSLPHFDYHCPLGSLPLMFGTELSSVPAMVPYLRADESLARRWNENLRNCIESVKIGITWAGNPNFQDNHTRSMNLDDLSSLGAVSGTSFFSLQKGSPAEQISCSSFGKGLVDLGPQLLDFADTAAAICSFDLVITTDTAVAHLAGALGKPVWLMLQFMPDWRWLLNRDDSPWYPTMRIFRQRSFGDWKDVVDRVKAALTAYSK
jgi:hypothetical protein